MQKIISLFQRNYDGDRLVRDEVVPGAEWVTVGEGRPTRKWDGTSCLMQDGTLYRRYDTKQGKTPPADFLPAQPEADPVTGHWPGWVPVSKVNPADRYHCEALGNWARDSESACGERLVPPGGTYELIGPKVQGNPDAREKHVLVRHGAYPVADPPRTFEGIRAYLAGMPIEGIVWHHPDGRMVKIKARDFGIPWPRK